MPDPIDFKVLVKQVVSDPKGLNRPLLPSTAIVSGNAEGDQGNRTGVYGRSERSIAIYGESPVFAGFFEGDVQIDGALAVEKGDVHLAGNLTVGANLKVRGHSFELLFGRLGKLEERQAQLEREHDKLVQQKDGVISELEKTIRDLKKRLDDAEVKMAQDRDLRRDLENCRKSKQ